MQAWQNTLSEPHAALVLPGWQAPVWGSLQPAQGAHWQTPLMQAWLAPQATQAFPLVPQSTLLFPAWQAPSTPLQPWQPGGVQAPLTQLCPAPQTEQSLPLEPQAALVFPTAQWG
jgi:hypothetical protein